MKTLKTLWAWLSLHLKTIVYTFSILSSLYFTFIVPLVFQEVCLPVWLFLVFLFLPFLVYFILRFYFTTSSYKKGDTVRLRGNTMPYFVIGYGFLNKHVIKIRHYHHEAIYYHEIFLEKI